VRRRWLRVALLVGIGALLALVAGPFIGALLILVTDAPLALMNVLAGIVCALATTRLGEKRPPHGEPSWTISQSPSWRLLNWLKT